MGIKFSVKISYTTYNSIVWSIMIGKLGKYQKIHYKNNENCFLFEDSFKSTTLIKILLYEKLWIKLDNSSCFRKIFTKFGVCVWVIKTMPSDNQFDFLIDKVLNRLSECLMIFIESTIKDYFWLTLTFRAVWSAWTSKCNLDGCHLVQFVLFIFSRGLFFCFPGLFYSFFSQVLSSVLFRMNRKREKGEKK